MSFAAGCGEGTADDGDGGLLGPGDGSEFGITPGDVLTAGAPPNSALAAEGKADQVFPAQFDLGETQSPVRNQGGRGVCSIFSTLGLMEHLYIAEGTITDPDFSEQYLQWSVKFEVGQFKNTSGSNANYNLEAINRFGVPVESAWPYETFAWNSSHNPTCSKPEAERDTECHTNGQPPQAALDAQKYFLPTGRWISTRTRDLKAHMFNKKQAVVVGGTFFYQAWNHGASSLPINSAYSREGIVLYPNELDRQKSREKPAGHSILLVGWDDTKEVQLVDGEGKKVFDAEGNPVTEKGFFIFKNSWGTGSFGANHPLGPGYGYISYKYVEQYKSGYISDLPVIEAPAPDPVCGEDIGCEDVRCQELDMCASSTGEVFEYEAEPYLELPDNDAEGVISEIEVTDEGIVHGVVVELLIEHSFRGDVEVELIHPDGTAVVVLESNGQPGQGIVETIVVNDLNGKPAAGTWKLRVADLATLDTGELLWWGLSITH